MSEPKYAIAVIGGATAGAEATRIFCEAGILTTVFEQNDRPYGKVEDGLPRWHANLRKKEFRAIDAKMVHPLAHFVPRTRLGEDITFRELAEEWGFSAIVLANGAWRDRPLPIPGVDKFVERGLLYQNPVIYAFNHEHEPNFAGPQFDLPDGTIVIGGGLASIDVAKVCQFSIVSRELALRGIETDVLKMEERGISRVLEEHGLVWEDLGLRGTTLYYRRRIEDMPLSELPASPTEAQIEKAAKVRQKILAKAIDRYHFRMEPLHAPVGAIVSEDGEKLVGIRFCRTKLVDGRLEITDEIVEVSAPLTISSIGSTPAPIAGIPTRGELYDYSDWGLGTFAELPQVYGVGNVVTGKGNLVASRKHAKIVASHLTDSAKSILAAIQNQKPLGENDIQALRVRIDVAQKRVGYGGDYTTWIESNIPDDLVS